MNKKRLTAKAKFCRKEKAEIIRTERERYGAKRQNCELRQKGGESNCEDSQHLSVCQTVLDFPARQMRQQGS